MEFLTTRANSPWCFCFLLLQSRVQGRTPSGSEYLIRVPGCVAGSNPWGPGFCPSQRYCGVYVVNETPWLWLGTHEYDVNE